MSKWKSKSVKIVQLSIAGSSQIKYGLGDDEKIYKWDYKEGAWEKYWLEAEDKPE